jgi:exodeoxyribonuclease-3
MRLTTWNCCWKLEEKVPAILSDAPDVAIIQECSEVSLQKLPDGYHGEWLHGAKNHGLGLICRDPYRLTEVAISDLTSFARIDIDGPTHLRLIAVWNCPPKSTTYPGHLHNFLDTHEDWFDHEAVILAGDLNSQEGASCDRGKRRHADFAARLKAKGLFDTYSAMRGSGQAAGPRQPTYRHLGSVEAPFHLDYIFASEALLQKATSIKVGSPDIWATLSDHSPVTIAIRDV